MTITAQAAQYQWDELPVDQPMEKITRRRIIGEKTMLSHVTLEKGFSVPAHAHDNEQLACVLSGKLRFGIGEDNSPDRYDVIVEGGGVLHLPPDVPHSAEALEDSVVLDVFSPPSETTGVDRK